MSKLSEKLREFNRPFCTMVVAAAGSSERMGEDKLFHELGGVPVLARTLMALERCGDIDEIIVVTREDTLLRAAELCERFFTTKVNKFLLGGEDRAHSALTGVTEADIRARLIGIHDGARPFVTPELVRSVIDCAVRYRAAAPALPSADTVKLAEDGFASETPLRSAVRLVQSPQVFHADLIKCALTNAVQNELPITDDCSAVEALGMPVRLVPGDPDNIKLTEPRDLELAEFILKRRGG